MKEYITSQQPDAITLNSFVTAIGLSQGGQSMDVATGDGKHHRFSHVISTIPLPVLRTLDLSGSKLTPMQANALRQLNYGPSVKIGLEFKTAWWTTGSDKDGKPLNIVGGQTYTDRILRTVVYPSFGNVQAGQTTTLIASYCWTEDSERLAALIEKDGARLLKIVLKELAEIHNVTVEFLERELIDSKSWSWTGDLYTMGGFPHFLARGVSDILIFVARCFRIFWARKVRKRIHKLNGCCRRRTPSLRRRSYQRSPRMGGRCPRQCLAGRKRDVNP